MRVAILGRTETLYETARAIKKSGRDIVFIATCAAAVESTKKEADFEALAKEWNVPFWNGAAINSDKAAALLASVKADVGVSLNWLTMIQKRIRGLFRYGILNAHAGDLPRYRGNACPNWALLNGEPRIGLCIHRMEDELDAGDIFARYYYAASQKTRYGEVLEWIQQIVPQAFVTVLNKIEEGNAGREPQSKNREDILRCYPRRPEDGRISWNRDAFYLERLVNASSEPLPGAFTIFEGRKIIVWRAYAKEFDTPSCAVPGQVLHINKGTGEVHVAAGAGQLALQSISVEEDTGRVKPAAVVTSLRQRFGI
jgi:UDP-4-amino-4-deoxy-L-arabinose formyltransferase/UDP-glucuronic acid dehydrogenase (UDP-4-keto-hexauronic acid decarboxylating)